MPSAGKSVVELVTFDEQHVAWVEVNASDRAKVGREWSITGRASLPIVLLWCERLFVWRTISQHGFFVFAEAAVLISRTPEPGLPSPDGSPPVGAEPVTVAGLVFPPAAEERLAQQMGAVSFRGGLASPEAQSGWCEEGQCPESECACSRCRLERGEPSL